MKKVLLFALLIPAMLVACSDETPAENNNETASLRIKPGIDLKVDVKEVSTRVSESDLTLTVTGPNDYSFTEAYSTAGVEINDLEPGEYTITLANFETAPIVHGFDKAYYLGSETVMLAAGENKPVNVTCSLQNVGVKFNYTQLAGTMLEGIVPSVDNTGGDFFSYEGSLNETAYIPHSGLIWMKFSLNGEDVSINGLPFAVIGSVPPATIDGTVEAGDLWEVTLKPGTRAGEGLIMEVNVR